MALQVGLLFTVYNSSQCSAFTDKACEECGNKLCVCFCMIICVFGLPWMSFVYLFSNRDSAIAFSDRIKSGVVGEQLWLQITDPTEKDMGKYAIEFNDGKGGLRRTVELSGQGENSFHVGF